MKPKIKVIIKRPDEEYGHVTNISRTLSNLQNTVGGYIETCHITDKVVVICNEEGKFLNLEPNCFIGTQYFVGNIIIAGVDEDDFTDIPFDFKYWKEFLDQNGGKIARKIGCIR